MPPHLNVNYEPLTVRYDENVGAFTDGERYYPYNNTTRATINTDEITFDIPTITNNYITKAEFDYRIDELKSKIYQIISEHSKLDITEEEFMNLLKE